MCAGEWEGVPGEGDPHLSSPGQGATSAPTEAPKPWPRALRVGGLLQGQLGGHCLPGGDFKDSPNPCDIFRHRSLLFYAVDQSPELYK